MVKDNTGFTADWWEHRSIVELRELSNTGLSGSGLCEAAALELERRALEAGRREEKLADEWAGRKRQLKLRRLTIAGVAIIIALALAGIAKLMAPSAGQAVAGPANGPVAETTPSESGQ
jgi:hypothetical protein